MTLPAAAEHPAILALELVATCGSPALSEAEADVTVEVAWRGGRAPAVSEAEADVTVDVARRGGRAPAGMTAAGEAGAYPAMAINFGPIGRG